MVSLMMYYNVVKGCLPALMAEAQLVQALRHELGRLM